MKKFVFNFVEAPFCVKAPVQLHTLHIPKSGPGLAVARIEAADLLSEQAVKEAAFQQIFLYKVKD